MPAQNLPFGRSMRCQIADKIGAHIGGYRVWSRQQHELQGVTGKRCLLQPDRRIFAHVSSAGFQAPSAQIVQIGASPIKSMGSSSIALKTQAAGQSAPRRWAFWLPQWTSMSGSATGAG
jgi:hypothetical protein